MEIQQNKEVSNDQGIGIDGLAGAGAVDKNYILDNDDLETIKDISKDKLTISGSVAGDSFSSSVDIKSVKKTLHSVLQEDEDKSYILNDEVMQLLESGTTEIDEAVNKYFQEMLGQGIEVNELIDEYSLDLVKLVNEQVAILKDQEDLVNLLSRMMVEIENVIDLEEDELLKLKNKIIDIETDVLSKNADAEKPELEETMDKIFTGKRSLFTEAELDVIDALIDQAEIYINEEEKKINNEQSVSIEQRLNELIKKAESLVKVNSNVAVVDASVIEEALIVESQKENISSLIDPFDPEVASLIDKLNEEGLITDEMNEEEVVFAIYNYIIREYTFSRDDEASGSGLQQVADTIVSVGGSSEDQSVLLVSLCLAAGVDDKNIKVYLMKVKDSEQSQVVCGYSFSTDTIVQLDISQRVEMSEFNSTKFIKTEEIITTISAYDGSSAVDVRSFIEADNPATQRIIELLRTEGILTFDMSNDEQVLAIYNHVVQNFDYISDEETGLAWQTAESTIETGGGDCEDLTILFVDLCLAAGVNEEKLRVYVNQGSILVPGHVVAGYTMDNGETIRLDLTVRTSEQVVDSVIPLNTNSYTFSFNSRSIIAYTVLGDMLVFEDPHYETSMYTAAAGASQHLATTNAMNTIIGAYVNAHGNYLGHVENLINYQQYFYEIGVDLSGVTEESEAFAAGEWMSFVGVDFEAMTEEFMAIQIQIYIMMASVILFNELLDVKSMLIQYLFEYQYENVQILSAQRISDKFSSEIGNLDAVISGALEDAMEMNNEAYENNMAEIERIANECGKKIDSKKRDAYVNVLVTHGSLLLLQQLNGVNDMLIESSRAAIAKIASMSDSFENNNIWQAVLDGGSVDNNLRVSARFDTMVMNEQTGYMLTETTMDISSMVLKILFKIDSWNDDRASIAAISAQVRAAQKQMITRYSGFLKTQVTNAENIKLAQKNYDDAVKLWNKVKKGPGFFGSFFFMVLAVIVLVVAVIAAVLTAGSSLGVAAFFWGCIIAAAVAAAALGLYAYSQLAYQKSILEQMEENLENDISLNYNLLGLDWVGQEYGEGGYEIGEILTTDSMALNFGNQMNNTVRQAWGLVQGMSSTGQIGDMNAMIMAFQIMLLSMLAIVDAMADARSAVMQVLFNVQTKVDLMQALQTWVNGTFANINSAFDYNSTMLFAQASEHNRKLQVEMQLKSVRQQISSVNAQMTRVIINTIVTVASMAALCGGWYGAAVIIVGALWSIYAALQSMAEAKEAYDLAKKLYEEYKDQFSVGPGFNIPDWLYQGVEAKEGNMGVLFQGLNSAMSGALGASVEGTTNFLAQMFAVLAISSAMMDARAIVITLLFGVNTGSQSKFVMAGFQSFGSYVMTMRSLEAQRAQLQMQVDKILADAQLAIASAKDSMNTANTYGWISIGIAIISIVASALKIISTLKELSTLSQVASGFAGVAAVANGLVGIAQKQAELDDQEKAIARMKEVYSRMFGINFDEFESSGTNSALTDSSFDIVNNAAGGMIASASGGRVTYDPSAALAAARAIKNWQRTWMAQIAVAQAAADAKQAVMSMLFRTPSTVENFQTTAAIVGYQAQAMQIALQLAVALAKMQVSAINAVVSAQENLAAAEAAAMISMAFSVLTIAGGLLQIGDSFQVTGGPDVAVKTSDGEVKTELNAAGKKVPVMKPGKQGFITNKLGLDRPWAKALASFVTGYGGDTGGFNSVITTVGMNLIRNLLKEFLTYYIEKEAREDFRSGAEANADKSFGKGDSGSSLSQKTVSNASFREDSAYSKLLASRQASMIDSMVMSLMSAAIDVLVGGLKTNFESPSPPKPTNAVSAEGQSKSTEKVPAVGTPTAAEAAQKAEDAQKAADAKAAADAEKAAVGASGTGRQTGVDTVLVLNVAPGAEEAAVKVQLTTTAKELSDAEKSKGSAAAIREEKVQQDNKIQPVATTDASLADKQNKDSIKYNNPFTFNETAADRENMKNMTPEQKIAYLKNKRETVALNQFSLEMATKFLKNIINEAFSQRGKTQQVIDSAQSGTSSGANFNSAIQGISSNATVALQAVINEAISTTQTAMDSYSNAINDPNKNNESKTAVSAASNAEAMNIHLNLVAKNDNNIVSIKDNKFSSPEAQQIIDAANLSKKSTVAEIQKVLNQLLQLEEFRYEADVRDCDMASTLMAALAQKLEITEYQLVISKDSADPNSPAHMSAEFSKDGNRYSLDFNSPSETTAGVASVNGVLTLADITKNPKSSSTFLTLEMKRQEDPSKAISGFEVDSAKVNTKHVAFAAAIVDKKIVMDSKTTDNDFKVQGKDTTKASEDAIAAAESAQKDTTAQAAAASQGGAGVVTSNNQSQGVSGTTPVVAQARQTEGGFSAELARRIEVSPSK
ncbi:MAG: transglutaminase domain-containing protein, partial [Candidatus Margulisbacteria bacterium]|nr:transglutaminase domain-containing protein [Candidatus Margulisiibacteriota bacterium]